MHFYLFCFHLIIVLPLCKSVSMKMNKDQELSSTLEIPVQVQPNCSETEFELTSFLEALEELPANEYIEGILKLGTDLTTDQHEYLSAVNKLDHYLERRKQVLLDNLKRKKEEEEEEERSEIPVDPILEKETLKS